MKKLNRKGFTLIELMAVIAILVIIMGLALPNITSSIERSKQKQKTAKIKLIESAAEIYFDSNKNSCQSPKGVSVGTLVTEGLVTVDEVSDTCNAADTECCVNRNGNSIEFSEDPTDCVDAC